MAEKTWSRTLRGKFSDEGEGIFGLVAHLLLFQTFHGCSTWLEEEGKAPWESKEIQDSLCCSCGCRSLLAKPALGMSEIILGFWNLLLLVFQDWRSQWEFLG